jgi:ankyrin repeat protein
MPRVRFFPVLALTTLLLAACSEPPQPTINLYRAIHAGDLDQIKRHLYWGTDVNQPDPTGDYPLHVAARRGRVVIAETLLDHGADANVRDDAGTTALEVALAHGKTQVAQVIVKAGASDEPQDLLFGLARAGISDRDSLKFLVDRGADVNLKDKNGDAPLHIAVRNDHLQLTKRLLDQGADVNLPGAEGRTPLEIAQTNGNRYISRELERFGAQTRPAPN